MSTQILPSLAGLGIEVTRAPLWDTRVQEAASGKETRVALWSYPRWRWDLSYNVLRSDAVNAELQQLAGFFNARQGMYDSFLYEDADDNSVSGQTIGTGSGSTLSFQLIRSFGGFLEPILAPHSVSAVYLDGVPQASGWSVSNWGSNSPGRITFASAPANGVSISADFSFYFPVRMTEDSVSFAMFLSRHYKLKKFSFISIK